jgi:hypothetical protein
MRRVVPITEVSLFIRVKASSMKWADLIDAFKKASNKGVCNINHCSTSYFYSINFFNCEATENIKEDLCDHEPVDE